MRSPRVLAIVTAVSALLGTACGGAAPQASGPPPAQPGPEAQAAPGAFSGTVAETMNSGGYTYARLQAAGTDDVWIAAMEFPAATGERLSVVLEMPVRNFQSKTLNRTFPLVYFISSVSRTGEAAAAAPHQGSAPPLMSSRDQAAPPPAVEAIAPPRGGLSIAEVWAKKTELAGKAVTVRGKVVKVNNQILGRNWVHLQDGSGSAGNRTNDVTITTDAVVKEGETITVTGVLATGKDFSAGYVYDVILENGRIVK